MKRTGLFFCALLSAVLCAAAESDEVPAAVEAAMAKLLPGVEPDAIAPGPMDGFFEVRVGPRLFYVSADGKFLIDGDVIDVPARSNLTEQRRGEVRLEAIGGLDEAGMITFSPERPKHTVTVFTDIDCTYCRRLHQEIDAYLAHGIRVRYLAYPRSGAGTPSYDKAVSVWCAEDRKRALTRAKADRRIEQRRCDNPVDQHLATGSLVGVQGTPTIVLEDGRVLPGFVPPERLAELLAAR